MLDNRRVVETAMLLRASAPDSWDAFVKAIRDYAMMAAADMVRCSPENLQRAQGMAQAAQDLAVTIGDAPKLYEKMKGQRHG